MSDMKLFKIDGVSATEIEGESVTIEKSLQATIERNLETFLGVKFLATEYSTGKTHGGRIDTLGIDENGCPVIIEYKRATNQNVINQGLFYLDWLMDHKGAFQVLVMEVLGSEIAEKIDARYTGNGDMLVHGVSSINVPQPGTVLYAETLNLLSKVEGLQEYAVISSIEKVYGF